MRASRRHTPPAEDRPSRLFRRARVGEGDIGADGRSDGGEEREAKES